MRNLGKILEYYATRKSLRFLISLTLIGAFIYVLIIPLAFVPLGERIDATGTTTTDYQTAGNKENMDKILDNWDSVVDVVLQQLFWDYIFIVGGFLFLFNANALILRRFLTVFDPTSRVVFIPKLGMVLTFFSRLFDAVENSISLLILTNSDNYPLWAPAALSITRYIKFSTVAAEYTVFITGLVILSIDMLKDRNSSK